MAHKQTKAPWWHILHVLWILMCFACQSTNAFRYLLLPFEGTSHILQLSMIGEALVNNGNEVYLVRPKNSMKIENINKVGIKEIYFHHNIASSCQNINRHLFETKDAKSALESMSFSAYTMGISLCESMMQDKDFLSEVVEKGFDLVLVDAFIIVPCIVILPHHLGLHFVLVSATFTYDSWLPRFPSYVPSAPIISNQVSDDMTFIERLKNSIIFFAARVTCIFPGCKNTTLIRTLGKEIPGVCSPETCSWEDICRQTDLFIYLSNHMLSWPSPATPNTLLLPGITYSPPKQLPEELYSVVTLFPGELVIVSFGSVVQEFPPNLLQKFLNSFGQSPHLLFIVKCKKPPKGTVEIPSNVHLMSWLPQNDLLGHEKTKLFITHCGNNGQHESLYHGVPMLGIPLFAEQHYNCFRIKSRQYGKCLDIYTFTDKELISTVEEMTSPGNLYYKNVQHASAILKDSPLLPKHEAAYWVEHVTKFGSKHLRPRFLDMPWYRYLMLDILGFILLMLIITFSVFYCILKILLRIIFRRNSNRMKMD